MHTSSASSHTYTPHHISTSSHTYRLSSHHPSIMSYTHAGENGRCTANARTMLRGRSHPPSPVIPQHMQVRRGKQHNAPLHSIRSSIHMEGTIPTTTSMVYYSRHVFLPSIHSFIHTFTHPRIHPPQLTRIWVAS